MGHKQSYNPAEPSPEERRIMVAITELHSNIERNFNIAVNTSPYRKKIVEEAVNAVYGALGDCQTRILTESLAFAKKEYQGRTATHKYKMSLRDLRLTMKAVANLANDIQADIAAMEKGIFELKRIRNQVQHKVKKKMRGRAGDAFSKRLELVSHAVEMERKKEEKMFDDDYPSIPDNKKFDAVKELEKSAGITKDGKIADNYIFG